MTDYAGEKPTISKAAWIVLTLCILVGVCEGVDLQAAGVAAPRLAPAFGIDPSALGLFFSSATFGLMFGALVGGRVSDRIGRKPALIWSVIIFGVMSIATGLATDYNFLVAARFLTGVGLGGAMPNLVALVAESVPSNRRSVAVGSLYASMPLGGAVAALVSMLIGTGNDSWRTIFYLGGFAPLVIAPLLYFALKDTKPVQASVATEAPTQRPSVVTVLFGENRATSTLILWGAFFLGLLVLYLLLNWLPTLLVGRGLERSEASQVQLAFNIAGVVGCVVSGGLMDGKRRAIAALGIFGFGAASLAMLAGAPASLVISILIGLCLGATMNGAQAVLYGLAPSAYPLHIRGTGIGSAVAFGRLGSAAGPLLAGVLVGIGLGAGQIMLVLVPIMLVAGGLTALLARRVTSHD
ncbi:3-(3-hydroxy-phenyl)propionate transporter MhpT [uncultured Brevundimonas sp.]|uniref:3-(3-hydroxy-phenyl)propionate transporter MhpT n=1 Tax=uncultured Brevundimonas sp. TaxID=213418 RepID=UPI002609747D|nr:3-(3-hydroxy-phenyl)propionate transporter MhpT [uncultured Brevundimonas sp.]